MTLNEIQNFMEKKVYQFMPKKELIQLVIFLIKQTGIPPKKAKKIAHREFNSIYEKRLSDSNWSIRLTKAYKGIYPNKVIEFWNNNGLAIYTYSSHHRSVDYSYSVRMITHIKPDIKTLRALCPNRFEIKYNEKTGEPSLESSVEVSRFKQKENDAICETGLIEVRQFNRPIYSPNNKRWEFRESTLPIKTELPIINHEANEPLLNEFLKDLKSNFTWESDDDFIRYIGYLIQPMLSHLEYGTFPGYAFLGPTKSGKNFLASYLPSKIYNRKESLTVAIRHMPKSEHETSIFLADSIDAIFVVFDEAINLDENQFKLLDSLITLPDLTLRKLHVGNIKKPNDIVFATTAVSLTLNNETEARVARIELTQTSPNRIDRFNRKWANKYSKILPAIFEKINNVTYESQEIAPVAHRRPGFGILKHFLRHSFSLNVSYPIKSSEDELLEDICCMHLNLGTTERQKYSLKNLQDYLAQHKRSTHTKTQLKNKIAASLSYGGSTKNDPSLKNSGYEIDGKAAGFHITYKKEGQDNPRTLIIVETITTKTSKIK